MITLREFNHLDVPTLVALLNDSEMSQYLSSRIPFPYTAEDALWWVSTGCKQGYIRAIINNQQLIGCVGIEMGHFEAALTGELGYWVGKAFWGKGIATEAVQQISAEIVSYTKVARLFASVAHPNKSSMRVLEKCGYQLEGIQQKACCKNGQFYDNYIYVKLPVI